MTTVWLDARLPVDQLSRAEHRVAVLAARGDTDQQVSKKLYVTTSTVERRLTKTYRELGAGSRTDPSFELECLPMPSMSSGGYGLPAGREGGAVVDHDGERVVILAFGGGDPSRVCIRGRTAAGPEVRVNLRANVCVLLAWAILGSNQ
ncbi:helix-turn-helix domain-containing protein [Streptosporangium jomthongense]|uniref:Helix-turn-helix transcriptional regulator n=1 Tax=Streptosporangium jomthongense TaxID=1193683 RepID=A0ABV8F7R6_9ACTN